MLVQGTLVKKITAEFGERRALLFGLLSGALGFAIYGLAPSPFLYCLGIPIMAFWGLAFPAAQALMTQRVSPAEQGQLQGAIASLTGVAGMLGPSLFTQLFAASIGAHVEWQLPGASYLLATLLMLVSAMLGWHATASRS